MNLQAEATDYSLEKKEVQKIINEFKEKELDLEEKLLKIQDKRAKIAEILKKAGLDPAKTNARSQEFKDAVTAAGENPEDWKSYKSYSTDITNDINKKAKEIFDELESNLSGFSGTALESVKEIGGLKTEVIELLTTLAAARAATDLSTSSIIANTIATKANSLAKNFDSMAGALNAIPGLITKLLGFIGGGLASLGTKILGFFASINAAAATTTAAATTSAAASATGTVAAAGGLGLLALSLAKLGKALLAFLGTLGKILAAVALVAIAFEGLWRWIVNGEEALQAFCHGTIATALADFLVWVFEKIMEVITFGYYESMANIEEKAKELDNKLKTMWEQFGTLERIKS